MKLFMWAFIGLLLTILGTFQQAFIASFHWNANPPDIHPQPLGITCQIGAVLLVGCLGGKNAGALAQVLYLVLGLGLIGDLSIFTHGGGLSYMEKPSFGYLLGFVPGAWVCGYLSFKTRPTLESLGFSCICGLAVIHLMGLAYTLVLRAFSADLLQLILVYSLRPLPAQIGMACAVAVIAFLLRRLLFIK